MKLHREAPAAFVEKTIATVIVNAIINAKLNYGLQGNLGMSFFHSFMKLSVGLESS